MQVWSNPNRLRSSSTAFMAIILIGVLSISLGLSLGVNIKVSAQEEHEDDEAWLEQESRLDLVNEGNIEVRSASNVSSRRVLIGSFTNVMDNDARWSIEFERDGIREFVRMPEASTVRPGQAGIIAFTLLVDELPPELREPDSALTLQGKVTVKSAHTGSSIGGRLFEAVVSWLPELVEGCQKTIAIDSIGVLQGQGVDGKLELRVESQVGRNVATVPGVNSETQVKPGNTWHLSPLAPVATFWPQGTVKKRVETFVTEKDGFLAGKDDQGNKKSMEKFTCDRSGQRSFTHKIGISGGNPGKVKVTYLVDTKDLLTFP